jgi:hypothetical protein
MQKNKLTDVNDILFSQLTRLSKESTKGDELKEEIQRARAVTDVTKRIIENGRLVFDSIKLRAEYEGLPGNMPSMLEGENGKETKKKT